MKSNILSSFHAATVSVLLLSMVWAGCTKKEFNERNIDPTKLIDLNQTDIKALFPTAEYAGMNVGELPTGGSVEELDYQQSENLFADMFCQYFAGTQTAFASHRYVINQQWVRYQWYSTYVGAMPPLVKIIEQSNTDPTIVLKSIARIWKVFVLHRTTDYFGPIPYSHIGSDSLVIPYDDQKDIYADFFKELTEAVTDLKNNPGKDSYGEQDKIYGGDVEKWIAFGNSLRLRLALRISKVDAAKAQQEAEAAVADGVMTDVAQDARLQVSPPSNWNGLARISGWNEFRMSTSMESLLKGYQDPRLSKFFQPAVTTHEYTGVRNGMIPAEQTLPANDYDQASNLAENWTPDSMYVTPMHVMNASESYFLRAEGALKGWSMGDNASNLYAKGIEMAMKTWGISDMTAISNYINSSNVPSAPGGYFHTPALTDIPVKFESSPERQMEQILTQKWLAIYPDGFEAWAEMRRTGYPKFYPLIHSENPDVPADKMIRRIPFLDIDRTVNGPAVDDAVKLLKGPDNAATRLWWDVE